MLKNKFGEMIFSEADVCDLVMQGIDTSVFAKMLVDDTVSVDKVKMVLEHAPEFISHTSPVDHNLTQTQFDQVCQTTWHMPDEYKQLNIAQHVLSLCTTDAELQRCGEELLLYQERDLFDLLRYLKYLVDTMKQHQIIWGVGRGSSVASHVLYLLGVHRIDSMYYELDIREFLR